MKPEDVITSLPYHLIGTLPSSSSSTLDPKAFANSSSAAAGKQRDESVYATDPDLPAWRASILVTLSKYLVLADQTMVVKCPKITGD